MRETVRKTTSTHDQSRPPLRHRDHRISTNFCHLLGIWIFMKSWIKIFFVSHEMLKKFKIYRKLKIRSLDNFIRGTESSPWRLKTIIILCVMFHDWYLEQLHVQKFKQNMWNLVPANICQIILDFYCWILFQTTRTLITVSFSRDHKRIQDFRERGQEKEFYNVVIEDDDNVDNVGADADPEYCPSL